MVGGIKIMRDQVINNVYDKKIIAIIRGMEP